MPTHHLQQKNRPDAEEKDPICLFAQTNFRNQMRRFGIKLDDRRRHMYVIGKTGMGKTTMLENMVVHDIYAGHGIGIVDPHGDFAEKIIDFIPPHRINDVIYVNPADVGYPMGFNILEVESDEQKHLVAAGLMAIFKKIWPDVWSSRMEYILNNTLLALLDYPGSTLLGINRMLGDKKYRKRVVSKLQDPVIKSFWTNEFANYEERYRKEAVAPIQNKIGQFLSASVIRNMVAQVKSTINIREAMDSKKIIVMNLSKGRIGEDNSRLLGGMLITKIQLAAMERVDTPEKDRKDFFLYVDEFQNFATESFANILSEARKYRLGLIMAHQYVAQLEEPVRDAVFGNVGTIVSFRIGAADAILLAQEFAPVFLEEDLVNLAKFRVFLKLMIDGVASQPFSAITMAPIGNPTGNAEKVIRVSRERYAKPRAEIEDKITRWSGMEVDDDEEDESPRGSKKGDKGGSGGKKSQDKRQSSEKKGSSDDKKKKNTDQKKESAASQADDMQNQATASNTTTTQSAPQTDDEVTETVSLASLLPASQTATEDAVSKELRDDAEKEVPHDQEEHSVKEAVDATPQKTESQVSDEQQRTGDDAAKKEGSDVQDVQQQGVSQQSSDATQTGEKKKRKRRRRRKKKGQGDGQVSSDVARNDQQQSAKPAAADASQASQQDVASMPTPQRVNPDEIVTFE